MVEQAASLAVASIAPSTRVTYNKIIQQFAQFTTSILQLPYCFPVNPAYVVLFVSHLHSKGFSGATIQSKLSAIAFAHKIHGYNDPWSHFLVVKAVRGAKKQSPTLHSRAPLSFTTLTTIISAIPRLGYAAYWATTFTAMLSLSFHGFLRPGEITSSPNNLLLSNVTVSPAALSITFCHFKHHIGEPVTIQIKACHGTTCPVKWMQTYLLLRGLRPGALFCDLAGNPVSYSQYLQFFASFKAFLRLSDHITPHSARIGAATHAATKGVPEGLIKQMGRWKSDAYSRYIRIPVLDTSVLGKG